MASTMSVQLATSTSPSTVAPAGLMAAPAQWQVRRFSSVHGSDDWCWFIFYVGSLSNICVCNNGAEKLSFITAWKWTSATSEVKSQRCANISSPYRSYQHKTEGRVAICLSVCPTRGCVLRVWHLSRRRPQRGVGVCSQTWHPWWNLQQLPGSWPE